MWAKNIGNHSHVLLINNFLRKLVVDTFPKNTFVSFCRMKFYDLWIIKSWYYERAMGNFTLCVCISASTWSSYSFDLIVAHNPLIWEVIWWNEMLNHWHSDIAAYRFVGLHVFPIAQFTRDTWYSFTNYLRY